MPKRTRRLWSYRAELLKRSQEAALTAVKVFNDPLVRFKSETFIVLMVIAWTYLLHAYYRSKGIEYRYHTKAGKRRRFERTTRGAFKYWELETCLNEKACPLDRATASNLRFLIGLRHEIEHQMTQSLDAYLEGRYQACALNYNEYMIKLFGRRYSLEDHLTYAIQFVQLTEDQIGGAAPEVSIPERLKAYIANFDANLTEEDFNSPHYSYRLLFTRELVNRKGQADRVVEFVPPDSELAKSIVKERWVRKEVERPKFRAKEVVQKVRAAGFKRFRVFAEHTRMWQAENARDPGKGYGVSISGEWFWYQRWVDRCIELCAAAGDKYK